MNIFRSEEEKTQQHLAEKELKKKKESLEK